MSNKLANCHALRMLTVKLLWLCLQPAEMRGNFKMFLETLFMTKKEHKRLNYISLKIDTLCKYTFLPATVLVLKHSGSHFVIAFSAVF
jgi:hypothetical protein